MFDKRRSTIFTYLLAIAGVLAVGCTSRDEQISSPSVAQQASPATLQGLGGDDEGDKGNVYQTAMRAGFESDVDAFVGGTRYFLDVDVSAAPHSITGHERVDYVNDTGTILNEVVFRLYPNSLIGSRELMVENIAVDGTRVLAGPDDDISILTVVLPSALAPDDHAVLEMDFVLDILPDTIRDDYGRLGHSGSVLSLPSFFPLLSVYDTQAGDWWRAMPEPQGDPVFSQSALFDVRLTAPSEAVLATVGQTLSRVDNGDGTTDYRIVTGPVRDFAIYMSNDYELVSVEENDITINVYSLPGAEADDAFALQTTSEALGLFSQLYGEYPFAELDVVETPTLAGGIEYPGLYVAASGVWDRNNRFFEIVIAHEIAHQWWYSLIGNDQVGQPWLDEGLAQYSLKVYLDTTYGTAIGNNMMASFAADIRRFTAAGGPDLPVGLSVSSYSDEEYQLFVYEKAPSFLATLETNYGDEAMQSFLRAYFDGYKYGIATRADIQSIAEQMLGDEDVRQLFDEWVGPQA